MEPDEEVPKIDIDSIKDAQNPMYQNVDISRQRCLSIIDRTLEKICIAYAIEEILDDNLKLIRHLLTSSECDSIGRLYKHVRKLEEIKKIPSTVLKGSNVFRPSLMQSQQESKTLQRFKSADSSANISPSIKLLIEKPNNQESDKNICTQKEVISNYYNYIIDKLHNNSHIYDVAKSVVYKKPIQSIKYYVYLKDLRDYTHEIIYVTQTQDVQRMKNVKQAYMKNLKELPQAKVTEKILKDKKKELKTKGAEIKIEIKNEKLKQNELNKNLIFELSILILNSEKQNLIRAEKSQSIQDDLKITLAGETAYYNKILAEDINSCQELRKKVQKLEVNLKKILEEYDQAATLVNDEYEELLHEYLGEKKIYDDLKIKHDIQEIEYAELMQERKEYIDAHMIRIRYNKGAKIIQHWWRTILRKRWQWRKTFIASQINRKSVTPEQRKKYLLILKKLKKKKKLLKF